MEEQTMTKEMMKNAVETFTKAEINTLENTVNLVKENTKWYDLSIREFKEMLELLSLAETAIRRDKFRLVELEDITEEGIVKYYNDLKLHGEIAEGLRTKHSEINNRLVEIMAEANSREYCGMEDIIKGFEK